MRQIRVNNLNALHLSQDVLAIQSSPPSHGLLLKVLDFTCESLQNNAELKSLKFISITHITSEFHFLSLPLQENAATWAFLVRFHCVCHTVNYSVLFMSCLSLYVFFKLQVLILPSFPLMKQDDNCVLLSNFRSLQTTLRYWRI